MRILRIKMVFETKLITPCERACDSGFLHQFVFKMCCHISPFNWDDIARKSGDLETKLGGCPSAGYIRKIGPWFNWKDFSLIFIPKRCKLIGTNNPNTCQEGSSISISSPCKLKTLSHYDQKWTQNAHRKGEILVRVHILWEWKWGHKWIPSCSTSNYCFITEVNKLPFSAK